jgi:hypothetical protein
VLVMCPVFRTGLTCRHSCVCLPPPLRCLQTHMPNVVVAFGTTAGSMSISTTSTLQGGLSVSSGATIQSGGLVVAADGAVISSRCVCVRAGVCSRVVHSRLGRVSPLACPTPSSGGAGTRCLCGVCCAFNGARVACAASFILQWRTESCVRRGVCCFSMAQLRGAVHSPRAGQ